MQVIARGDEQLVVGLTKNQCVWESMNQDPTQIAMNQSVLVRGTCGVDGCLADGSQEALTKP